MPPAQPPTDYRQRLIQALAVVISRDGFHGAKIQDVARQAKVSLRTFYAEFPNKEACFLELYDQQCTALEQLVERASVQDGRPMRVVMTGAIDAYLSALAIAPRLTHAGLVELATLSPEARRAREDALDRFVALLIQLVEDARATHPHIPSRPLTPLMARAILGGVTELMVNRVARGETERLPELVETTTDMLWSVVTNVTPIPDEPQQAANAPKSGVRSLRASNEADVRR